MYICSQYSMGQPLSALRQNRWFSIARFHGFDNVELKRCERGDRPWKVRDEAMNQIRNQCSFLGREEEKIEEGVKGDGVGRKRVARTWF